MTLKSSLVLRGLDVPKPPPMSEAIQPTKADFGGLRVLSLESRMATPMERLIEKYGGRPLIAPSLKEVPLAKNQQAFEFFEKLESGQLDLVLLMTGVGLRYLLKTLAEKFPGERIVSAFAKTKVVVRGPKPTQVCQLNKIAIDVTVPAPNTWQEILQILSETNLLSGKRVALLEYGRSDTNFLQELSARGAEVTPVGIYRWELPDDTKPLKRAFEDIINGQVDVLLQTSAIQIDHLLKMSESVGRELQLRRALAQVAIFSIGPTTTAHLHERQIFPDKEVFPNKKETLVEEAARQAARVLEKKRARADSSWIRARDVSHAKDKQSALQKPLWEDSSMMKACRRQPVDRLPVWLMRQAGRYMEEYQLVRRGKSFLDFCKDPDLCTEATLTAVERLDVDAAILFSDILPILEPMGMELSFVEGAGPLIANPIRSLAAIEALKPVSPEDDLGFALQAVKQIRAQMHPRLPLIGFSGAPFTLASYMIEGKGSRNYLPTKTLMHSETKAWHLLMEKLTTAVIAYLRAQVAAGCQILQVFDSWVGCLSPADYQNLVFPHMQRLFSELRADLGSSVPLIHFGTGTATILSQMRAAGGDVIGMDWRMDPKLTWESLGQVAVQGNLDPVILFSKPEVILKEAEKILQVIGSKPGFIFNLGHGILPETPVDNVMALVDFVHGWRKG